MKFVIKNSVKEFQLFKKRIIAACIIICLLSLLLIWRLIDIQIIHYKLYTTLSKTNDIALIPIPPRRGLIFDRNGILIANNKPVFSLMVTPNKIKNLQKTINSVSKIIPINQNELLQFYKQLKQRRRFDQIPLKLKLTNGEVARFAVNRQKFPGISVHAELIRNYPLGAALSMAAGHVGRISEQDLNQIDAANYAQTIFIGKTGIEKYYESLLHGLVGYKKVEINAAGETIRTIEKSNPVQGSNIYLTIDSNLQINAERTLGSSQGAIVAIQPNTGQILALVSNPAYNPNLFVIGISNPDYQTLLNDKAHPLFNRAIRGLYAPGSVIKPFIAVEGLNSKIITPSFRMLDHGWFKLPNAPHIFHDWKWWISHDGHGWVNLEKAIIESCDTYFFNLANELGIQRIDNILNQFNFGQLTGIDINSELAGNVPTPKWKFINHGIPWYAGDTILLGIGQSYIQITPLQLAMATATLANHGTALQPHLLYAVQKPNEILTKQEATPKTQILLDDPSYWDDIINAMGKVITQGTGFRFGKPSYSIAAKTGTAQVVDTRYNNTQNVPKNLRDNSVFIAFAPIKNPKIAIAVIAENNKSAPVVARKILDYYLLRDSKKSLLSPKKTYLNFNLNASAKKTGIR